VMDTTAGATARADGRKYVTLNASVNYLRSGRSGRITAVGRLVRRGRSVTVVDVSVTDEAGKLLTTGTLTMFCVDSDGSVEGVKDQPIR
jgi:acyl-CoA thioesterase